MDEVDSNLQHHEAKRVALLVKNLCENFVSPATSSEQTNATPARYDNIRVLNKSEIEIRFADYSSSEGQCKKSPPPGNMVELVAFVDRSLSHEALAAQRRVNLLSRSKQGRNTSKG